MFSASIGQCLSKRIRFDALLTIIVSLGPEIYPSVETLENDEFMLSLKDFFIC